MTTLKEEEPYAVAVTTEYLRFTCSKCFAWNFTHLERVNLRCCEGCEIIFYCSEKCEIEDWKDHRVECEFFRSSGYVPSKEARLVMRILEKSKKQPNFVAFNGRTYDSLMHHSSKRSENATCMTEATTIYGEICRFMGSKAPDFEKVFLALCKKAINAFPLYVGTYDFHVRGIGLYIGLSVLDHSCRPDAFIVNQGQKMMLRTTNKDLVYNDKLTISYSEGSLFRDTYLRRDQLQNHYFFHCKCEACEDIEANEKKTSGRSACCPNSWFSFVDRICNNCKQKVSPELADKTEDAMIFLKDAVLFSLGVELQGVSIVAFIREWMKRFDAFREVLSDENMYLISASMVIYHTAPLTDMDVACKLGDLAIQQARKNPHCIHSAALLARRVAYHEVMQKTRQETREALNEALDSAQVVFGAQHDLTDSLLEKQPLADSWNIKIDNWPPTSKRVPDF